MQSGSGHGRGRHKGFGSKERRAWDKIEDTVGAWPKPEKRNRHGIPVITGSVKVKPEPPPVEPERKRKRRKRPNPPPACPPWLRPEEYAELVELRKIL